MHKLPMRARIAGTAINRGKRGALASSGAIPPGHAPKKRDSEWTDIAAPKKRDSGWTGITIALDRRDTRKQ